MRVELHNYWSEISFVNCPPPLMSEGVALSALAQIPSEIDQLQVYKFKGHLQKCLTLNR
jgi:hypothetical protein